MNIFQKLKSKWGIESNVQFVIINIVFAITGSLTLFVRRPIFALLDIDKSDPFLLRTVVYLLTVTPAYLIMLIIIGTLFGQFKFFWAFEKHFLGRMVRRRKKNE